MSGLGHEQDKRDSIGAGFEAHLVKPNIIDPLLALFASDESTWH